MNQIQARVDKLRNEIEQAQREIDKIKGAMHDAEHYRVGEITCTKISVEGIENFDRFPEDYRCFVTEIGLLNASLGYEILTMREPQKLTELKDYEDYEHFYDDEFGMLWTADLNKQDVSKLLMAATAGCRFESFAFDGDTYAAVPLYCEGSFLDFAERHLLAGKLRHKGIGNFPETVWRDRP